MQALHRRLDVEVGEAECRQRLACAAGFLTPADPAAEARLVAGGDGQVVDRVQHADEPEVLVHEPDAGVVRGRSVAQRERLRRSTHASTRRRVGLVVAGEDLDQRRLAGAVLADERVHFARGDIDADVVERDLARERLRQVLDSERVSHHPPIRPRD